MPRRKVSNAPITVPNTQIGVAKDRTPEPTVEVDLDKPVKPITFFSRFREDELMITQSTPMQVGPNKWITSPAKTIKFHDRAFVTNDQDKINFLRKHPRYGYEIFEFGVPGHEERIAKIDDAGRILDLERLARLGRIVESRMRKGLSVE